MKITSDARIVQAVKRGDSLLLYSSKKSAESGVPKLTATLAADDSKILERLPIQYLKFILERKRRYMENFTRQTQFNGHVLNILKLQYDDLSRKLSCGAEVADALNQIYAELYSHFENAAALAENPYYAELYRVYSANVAAKKTSASGTRSL